MTSRAPTAAGYRADIDGLRAVAVLAVLAFHAFPGRLAGGFSGVDVFFVISGYLIARDICTRLDERRFSLVDFYVRRIRRIFPALIVVLVATATFGWVVLLPDELKQLFSHVWSSAAFAQNFRLLAESGYFDTNSGLKPLLHLWSLSIEEQFYLLCPLVLMAARAPALRWALVGSLALASFAANLWAVTADPAGAYYLPSTRSWQILAGVLLALAHLHPNRIPRRPRSVRHNAMAWFGAALLATGFVLLNKGSRYPGWLGLVPTVGTVLLIAAAPGSWLAANLLSRDTMAFIGRISYPLYLWHWPVLVFIRILDSSNPSTGVKLAGLALSGVLAVLTYGFIERRGPRVAPRRDGGQRVAVGLAAGMVCVGVAALALDRQASALPRPIMSILANEGALRDLNFAQNAPRFHACSATARAAMPGLGYCLQSSARQPTAAIVGDSHAFHLFHGVAATGPQRSWLLAGNQSCPPVIGISVKDRLVDCGRLSELALRAVAADRSITTVVLAFRGSYATVATAATASATDLPAEAAAELTDTMQPSDNNSEMMLRGLDRAVALLEASAKTVVLFIDVPELPFQPRDCIDRPLAARRLESCTITRASVLAQQATLRGIVQRLADGHAKMRRFDPLGTLCDARTCAVKRGDMLVYRDSDHLSLRGSEFLARPFLEWLGP